MQLEGKRIVVTGASRGIGRSLTRQLTDRGATVLAVAREVDGIVQDMGPMVQGFACDLANPAARADLIRRLGEAGAVDVLINNAAIQIETDYLSGDPGRCAGDLALEIEINLVSPLALSIALLPQLASRTEAAIMNVTSALALAPKQDAPVYCATKAGLRSFTTGLRYQTEGVAPHVTVTDVVMALVDTDMTRGRGQGKISPEQAASEIIAGLVRGRAQVWVGKTRLLRGLHRLSPALAARILR